MSDPLGKITEGKDLIGKIRNTVSGFLGYFDRENRREADKILRGEIAKRYEEQWSRISGLQRQLISGGQLKYLDDLEEALVTLRSFKITPGKTGPEKLRAELVLNLYLSSEDAK